MSTEAAGLVGQSDPTDVLSNVNKGGEWKTRKINLWSLMRSFVSQLKLGQDLTKISLPAEMCHPFSMLEVVAFRETTLFKLLYGINDIEDPLQRFLLVLKWHLSMVRQEHFDKKPYNPVLGETHVAYVESPEHGMVEFVSEQVSHHPPVSAFSVRNSVHNLDVVGNISFGVKFGGNSVTVATAGGAELKIQKFNDETYALSRLIPDMLVRNVVWGTKYIIWSGEFTLSCKETGFECELSFSEAKNKENRVEGKIKNLKTGELLFTLSGQCGNEIWIEPAQKNNGTRRLLLDVSKEVFDEPKYLPENKLDSMSSVSMWSHVNQAIIDGNIPAADAAKQKIEDAQRKKRAERAAKKEEYGGVYFHKDSDNIWRLDDGVTLPKLLAGELSGQVKLVPATEATD